MSWHLRKFGRLVSTQAGQLALELPKARRSRELLVSVFGVDEVASEVIVGRMLQVWPLWGKRVGGKETHCTSERAHAYAAIFYFSCDTTQQDCVMAQNSKTSQAVFG